MKNLFIQSFAIFFSLAGIAQILPGTLDVRGFPSFVQNSGNLVREAGQDDKGNNIETDIDATEISFILDPTLFPQINSKDNCEANVFRYSVFVHREDTPEMENSLFQARTFTNSGERFPKKSLYDLLLVQPLGPRDLTPENGGAYINIPDNGAEAIKIMEFIGCRTKIPIQFNLKPSLKTPAGNLSVDIYYTVVGSLN